MDGGAWGATVHGVAKSRTRLSNFTHSLTHRDKTLSLGLGRAGGEIGDDCIKLGFPKDSPQRKEETVPNQKSIKTLSDSNQILDGTGKKYFPINP